MNRYCYVGNNPLKYVDLWGHQGELPKKKGKKGEDDEIPADRENEVDDGECPCPVYVTTTNRQKYVPNDTELYTDWFSVLRGRLSFGTYVRNGGWYLSQSYWDGAERGVAAGNAINEALADPGVQFALAVTGTQSILSIEDDVYVTVGRWMSKLELDKMTKTGLVQESIPSGTTDVVFPSNILGYLSSKPGTLYVEFQVPKSSVKVTQPGWAKILGPNTLEGRLAAKKGQPVPQMPKARNIQCRACRTRF